jgi:acetyltransferase
MQGWRDVPAADVDAVVMVLQAISDLLAAEPRIQEIDINPLLADAQGVIALDARVRVNAAARGGAQHFAIPPYPAALTETWDWLGREVIVRPIRPEDEAQHLAFLQKLDPEDVRLRVFYSRRSIERTELARLTQIDYGREMAFIATTRDANGQEETLAAVRAISDPDNDSAEFGITVRSDVKGGGLGKRLMNKLIAYQRAQGTRWLVATVLQENDRMLKLAHELGFSVVKPAPEPGVSAIQLDLQA